MKTKSVKLPGRRQGAGRAEEYVQMMRKITELSVPDRIAHPLAEECLFR
jgi:hypothetical protein